MSDDLSHLRRALRLAARGRYDTSPNPMVGAVVVRDGRTVGEGWHRRVGGAHAEREALAAAGAAARGATLYVTLEPCAHHGRTPPCAETVRDAGIARVVACHRDPDPRVAGRGFALLRTAGVEVAVGGLIEEAVRLNLAFLVATVTGRPAVTLKWAMSLDGKIATAAGDSRWISSPEARRWGLELRETHDAILVGSGTALADDPRLNRRMGKAGRPILRAVLDRRLRLPPTARLFDEEGPVLVYTRSRQRSARSALAARGAELVDLPAAPGEGGEVAAVLRDLGRRQVRSLLVEGGGEVLASFVESGLWERVAVDCAPILVGGVAAPSPLAGRGVARLAAAARLEEVAVTRRGEDVILTGARQGCLRELLSSVAG